MVKDVLLAADTEVVSSQTFACSQKKPATGMRCGAKKLAGCGQPMELYKRVYWLGTDAFLYGAFKTRKQEVPGQQIQLVDEHFALGLRNGRGQRTALQCRYDAVGVLSIGFIAPFNADTHQA